MKIEELDIRPNSHAHCSYTEKLIFEVADKVNELIEEVKYLRHEIESVKETRNDEN